MTEPLRPATGEMPARSRWPLLAGGAAAVVLAGVIGFLFFRGQSPVASETPSPTLAPSPSPTFNPGLLDNRLTVLLLGLDTSEKRRGEGKGVNSDSIMLASVNEGQTEVTLVSIPRDVVDVPLADGTIWQQKINAIFSVNGVQDLVEAVESLLQVEIDGYVQVDMDDFSVLVDAVGGLRANPKTPLVDAHLELDIPAGPQHVDGETALDYVRTRVDSDYARAARQQELILKLVDRLVAPGADVDMSLLLDSLNSFETDLSLDDLPTLIEIARRAESAHVVREVLDPSGGYTLDTGDQGDGRGWVIIPNVEAMRAFAAEHLGE